MQTGNGEKSLSDLFEMLNYSFMQNALIAIVLISIASGVIGSLVVANRMVFVAGGIAHGAYGGVGAAFYFGFAPLLGASVFAVLLSIVIAYLWASQKERIDSVIGALWAFGMALGILLLDLSSGYNVDLMSYLFGSLLSVSEFDLILIAIFDFIMILVIGIFYKEILSVSYDEEFAKLRGINTNFYRFAMIILTGLAVIVTIRAVGLILVIALLSIPSFLAEKFSSSLGFMMLKSSILSFAFSIGGLLISYKFDVTSGAAIILTASGTFLVYGIWNRFKI